MLFRSSKIETPSFRFVYKKNYSIVLKKFLNNNGVSHSVLKDIRKYKSGFFVNGHNVYDNFQLHKGIQNFDNALPEIGTYMTVKFQTYSSLAWFIL